MRTQTVWPKGGGPVRIEYSTSTDGMVAIVKIHFVSGGVSQVDKRVWRGETAHMDGERFFDDTVLALNHGREIPSA